LILERGGKKKGRKEEEEKVKIKNKFSPGSLCCQLLLAPKMRGRKFWERVAS